MIQLASESDKRLIVGGKLNGRDAHFLIDTGATAGLIHKGCAKEYKLSVNRHRSVQMVGAGGKFRAFVCDTPFVLQGRSIYQFLVADIASVVESIRKQTGIEIQGILSLPQCKTVALEIDTDDNLIRIKDIWQ